MFPPKPTKNPQEWLTDLWGSLQRAGHHFGSEAQLELGSDGSIRMRSKMREPLPKEMKAIVATYMRRYARAAGWNLQVSFKKGYCELEAASRAASSSSRNL